jgi:signal transduction histidine kinase
MRTLVSNYLKQFVASVTGWQDLYKTDVLFRATVGAAALLISFALIYIALFVVLSLKHASIWLALLAVVATGAVFGFLAFRFMLMPTRNTLHYQKLFISNVAHELRTPLSTIKTSSEVALLDERLSAPTVKIFGEIVHELDRISEIINNLLSLNTLNRPERMRFSNIDLGPLVETVVGRHHALANERKIAIVIKKDGPAIVWGNATALEQVIANLIKNAIIYTQKNNKGKITLSLHPDYQGSIIFSVSDNGIGIAQRDLAHIFEPFYRADTSRVRSVKSTGSGLGLAIVNEIVRAHHGKLNIESARNQGTTVSVMLPLGISRQMAKDIADYPNTRNRMSLDFSHGLANILPPQNTKPERAISK